MRTAITALVVLVCLVPASLSAQAVRDSIRVNNVIFILEADQSMYVAGDIGHFDYIIRNERAEPINYYWIPDCRCSRGILVYEQCSWSAGTCNGWLWENWPKLFGIWFCLTTGCHLEIQPGEAKHFPVEWNFYLDDEYLETGVYTLVGGLTEGNPIRPDDFRENTVVDLDFSFFSAASAVPEWPLAKTWSTIKALYRPT